MESEHRAGHLLDECLRRGVLTVEDLAALTGHDPEDEDLEVDVDGDRVTVTTRGT